MAIYAPVDYRWLDAYLFGRANISELAGHLALILAAWAAASMVGDLLLRNRRLPARLGVATAVVAVAMTVVFLSGHFPRETTDFTTVYGRRADIRAYWSILLLYLAVVLVVLVRQTLKAAPRALRWTRLGLRLIAAGASSGLVYLAHWAAFLVFLSAGREPAAWFNAAALPFGLLAGVLLAAGTTLPVGAARVREGVAVRRLHPLWVDVTARYPAVRSVDDARPTSYRLLVEIRDAVTHLDAAGALHDPMLREIAARPAPDVAQMDDEVRWFEELARRFEVAP